MQKEKFTKKHQKILGILSVIVFILFMVFVGYFIGVPLVKLASEPEIFRSQIESYGILGSLVFIGMIALQVFFAIIPGEPLEIVAGYAFGALEGTILCLLGCLAGGLAVFAFVRKFGVRVVETFFSVEKINNLKLLSTNKRRNIIFFVVFLIPGTPKDLLLYFMCLTKITLPQFLLITTLVRIPSIVTSTLGGNALGIQNYKTAVIVFAVTILLSLIGVLVYKFISRRKK